MKTGYKLITEKDSEGRYFQEVINMSGETVQIDEVDKRFIEIIEKTALKHFDLFEKDSSIHKKSEAILL